MTGVEILATQEVVTKHIFNWCGFAITFCIIFLIYIIIGILVDRLNILFFVIIGILIGVLCGCVIGSAFEIPTEYETHYKVTVSDKVPMNEFLDRYEIVDQEGRIYTVIERNGDNNGN